MLIPMHTRCAIMRKCLCASAAIRKKFDHPKTRYYYGSMLQNQRKDPAAAGESPRSTFSFHATPCSSRCAWAAGVRPPVVVREPMDIALPFCVLRPLFVRTSSRSPIPFSRAPARSSDSTAWNICAEALWRQVSMFQLKSRFHVQLLCNLAALLVEYKKVSSAAASLPCGSHRALLCKWA